ncbi:divalent-cation tolerance protein CutA [Candidatus Woesearchaeota archaeon]|nr:divalent-cation tolerance protein CutA [Candidatus Woesearchaeota archaeon]
MISVYIACRDEKEARLIGLHLLERRLIACANIFPVKSLFRWRGKITEETEAVMICKTQQQNFERIKEEARQLHSYEIPCIIALPWVEGDEEYKNWVRSETHNDT